MFFSQKIRQIVNCRIITESGMYPERGQISDQQYAYSSNSAVTIKPRGVCSMLFIIPSLDLIRSAFL